MSTDRQYLQQILGNQGIAVFDHYVEIYTRQGANNPAEIAFRTLETKQGRQFKTGNGRARQSHGDRKSASQAKEFAILTVSQAIDTAKNAATGKQRRAARKMLHDRFVR
jgi:hypothetical protein